MEEETEDGLLLLLLVILLLLLLALRRHLKCVVRVVSCEGTALLEAHDTTILQRMRQDVIVGLQRLVGRRRLLGIGWMENLRLQPLVTAVRVIQRVL